MDRRKKRSPIRERKESELEEDSMGQRTSNLLLAARANVQGRGWAAFTITDERKKSTNYTGPTTGS